MVDVIVIEGGAMAEAGLLNRDAGKRDQGARSEPLPAQFTAADVGCNGGRNNRAPGKP